MPSIPDSKDDKRDGRYAWYQVKLDIDGINLNISHQGAKPGSRAWGTENALLATIKSAYFHECEHKKPITRYWVSAHYHQAVYAPLTRGMVTVSEGFVLPAFQAITEHSNKVGAHVATIGMLIIVIEDGRTWHECNTLALDVERVVKI